VVQGQEPELISRQTLVKDEPAGITVSSGMVTSIGRPAVAELQGPAGVGVVKVGYFVCPAGVNETTVAESSEGLPPVPAGSSVVSAVRVKDMEKVSINEGVTDPLDNRDNGAQSQEAIPKDIKPTATQKKSFFIDSSKRLQLLILLQFQHLINPEKEGAN